MITLPAPERCKQIQIHGEGAYQYQNISFADLWTKIPGVALPKNTRAVRTRATTITMIPCFFGCVFVFCSLW